MFISFLEEREEDVCMREEREGAAVEEGFSEGIKFLGYWFLSSCRLKVVNLVTIKDLSSYTFHLYLSTGKHEEGGQEEELPYEEEQKSKLNFINVTFPTVWFEVVLIGLIS